VSGEYFDQSSGGGKGGGGDKLRLPINLSHTQPFIRACIHPCISVEGNNVAKFCFFEWLCQQKLFCARFKKYPNKKLRRKKVKCDSGKLLR
jgi:hypothetical protein